jgi:hypothetical protein
MRVLNPATSGSREGGAPGIAKQVADRLHLSGLGVRMIGDAPPRQD